LALSQKTKRRFAISVNHSFCTGCANCIEFCPQHVLDRDPELNKRGIHAPIVTDVDGCTGCQLCEMFCGNFSIAIGEVQAAGEIQ
jgi:2-oxoglutarate ferredoxin oxidoreductase subunit delta